MSNFWCYLSKSGLEFINSDVYFGRAGHAI
jgi:hypothetical protein